ncbi:MAG: DNA polymerase-3 subunit delta' [Myxococcota bacterium]|jgi:DNA polymerase-3 subunit delta'
MPFSSILGHESIIAGLRAAHDRGRVPHAYLFSGPEGIGKQLVATAFAQLINCTDPQPSTDGTEPCGVCRPCRMIEKGTHPDLLTLEPDGRFIKVDRIREMTKTLRFPPVEAASRVVIFHSAEAMNDTSANAILKTLEEPSARNTFILMSPQPNRLLPTILSRCQQVRFTALPRAIVADYLEREHGLDPAAADEVAGMSHGSLGDAVRLVDPELTEQRGKWLDVLDKLPGMGPTQLMDLAEALAADKASLRSILDALRMGLRDRMLRAAGAREDQLTFRSRTPEQAMTPEATLEALGCIDEAEESLLGNVNARMVGEHMLMGLRRAIRR